MTRIIFYVAIVVISVNYVWNMEVIFERSNVPYANEKYVTGVKMYVRRYERRGKYYLNLVGTNKHTWDNNVTVNFVFYEFLHNEYKRSFVEFAFKLCDIINETRYIGRTLMAAGLVCPMPIRDWRLVNMSFPGNDFPNVFPFEKCRIDAKVETFPEKEHIVDFQIYVLVKQGIGK